MKRTNPDDKLCSCGTPRYDWIMHRVGDNLWFQCLDCGECYIMEKACEFCRGHKYGLSGNENVIGGHILCDYCAALWYEIKEALEK